MGKLLMKSKDLSEQNSDLKVVDKKSKFDSETPVLETERLVLRRLEPTDADAMFRYTSDSEVVRYIEWNVHQSVEETKELIFVELISPILMIWAICLKDGGEMIGNISIMLTSIFSSDERRGEVGFNLARAYWNQGFTTEALKKVLDYGFQELGMEWMYGYTSIANKACSRVMEKAGMLHEGTVSYHMYIDENTHEALRFGIRLKKRLDERGIIL